MPRTKRETNGNNSPESALDRAQVAYEQARETLRALQGAMLTVAGELKTALREQKAQAKEMDTARTALSKLQSINL